MIVMGKLRKIGPNFIVSELGERLSPLGTLSGDSLPKVITRKRHSKGHLLEESSEKRLHRD